uniref:Niban 1/2/3 domain-containing protein n=1 Tax=Capra hircus TaxID=9925 RepID=A0A8C2SKR3_CAPHI
MCNYPGKTEAAIKNFSPYYSRQYSVAFCNHVRSEVEQQRDLTSQFLKTKPPLEPGTVLYEGELSQFAEDIKKWKERYVVVKNDFAVESYENREAYQKGAPPKSRILPAGGKVLTSEDEYNLLSDRHFPDPIASNEKENTQPFVVLPKEFPVYLWQPFLRHGYFCFQDAAGQKKLSAVLSDCIRHLNHDYMKQTTFEAQAFLEAVQFFRQEKGHYGSWEMVTGDEVQILSNLVMEELMPTLQTDILPRMKGKKNDRKRAWFGLLEEAYHLVQHRVSEGLSALKEECRALTKGLEGTIRSDMDQIVNSKNFLIGKIKAMVAQPAERSCAESVQPFLGSILEELMGPVSSGFSELRSLFEKEVDELSQSFQTTKDSAQLKELMENAVFTFEQLLSPHLQGEASKTTVAIEKVKLRVLKQYDYDSSTIRKRIFQEALVQITLPTLQKALASVCKPELQKYEQYIFADHTNMIHVENVYEEILHQILLDESLKVIKEAAILKKHNLFEDNMALPSESVSSLTDLKTPAGSNQASPARRASAVLPGVSESEILSNEVFQEAGEMKQPEVPSPLAREEGLSLPVSSPPPDGDTQVIDSSIDGPVVNLVATEVTAGALGTHLSQLELEETPEGRGTTQEDTEPSSAAGSLKELRNLLTVTAEVPEESAVLEVEKDTHEEALVPQDTEKEEEATQIDTEASQPSALGQDNCEESEVSEGEARGPAPKAEASGVELGEFPDAQPACGGLSEGAWGPDPTEEPGEPAESKLTEGASGLGALEGGGPMCSVEAEAVPLEACVFRSDPISPRESQVSVEEEAVGGSCSAAQPATSEDAQERKADPVHECQWVVENVANINTLDTQREDPPEPPSEE